MSEEGMAVQIPGTFRRFPTLHHLLTQLAEQQSLQC
jgi:hypothetical protein